MATTNKMMPQKSVAERTSHQPLKNKKEWQELSASRKEEFLFKRLIDRCAPFHQSAHRVNVRCTELHNDFATRKARWTLIFGDWFDYVLSFRTTLLVFIIIIVYTVLLVVWALFYISINCDGVDPLSFQEAMGFSLITATTVGYGLVLNPSQMFFGGCGNWIAAVYFQSITSMLINGFVLGIVMMRVQRANRRSRQIIFSDKACIICVRGKFYMTCQVFDLAAAIPVIGVTVRMLAVFHEPSEYSPAFFQTRVMRLTRPDDETGAKLWLTVPSVIIHEIDMWSPLAPMLLSRPPVVADSSAPTRFPQPSQRAIDGRTGSRQQGTCFVCGVSFSTEGGLRRHIEYMAEDERARGVPESFGHCSVNPRDVSHPLVNRSSEHMPEKDREGVQLLDPEEVRDEIRDRIVSRKLEIIVIVEGMDPHTSNLMQACHSYTAEDIEFDKQHAPCMITGKNGFPRINLSQFHKLYEYDEVNIENAIPFASHT